MSTPPAPPQAELFDRTFSFYPPIHFIDHNEWRLVQATWSEMLVANAKSGIEVAIPRSFFGAVSEVEKPVVIVGLTQELEYKAGTVWPVKKRVLEMPASRLSMPREIHPAGPPDPNEPTGLSAMMGHGGDGTDSRISKLIGGALLSVIALTLVIWAVIRFAPETKPTFVAKDQSYLELNREDDIFSVTRKLGRPSEDRWKPSSGELQYRALFYKDRGYAIILMGDKQENVHYIGAIGLGPDGKGWSPLHSVDYARGASTFELLRSLPKF